MTRQHIATLVLALAGTALGTAQTTGKVAVINIQGAIVTSKDGQKAATELEAKATPKRKALEARQSEINALKEQLQKGANTLSETAKQEIARNIDAKTKSFNRQVEDAQAEGEQEQQKIIQDLGGRMLVVIEKYAKDHGFALVLDVSSPQTPVLFASEAINITKDIIDLYDKSAASAASTTSSVTAPSTTRAAAASAPAAPRSQPPPASQTARPKP